MEKTIKIGVLIVNNNNILLIKEWSESKHDFYWNIIKGTYEELLDKKFVDCAIREAQEEVGVTISVNNFVNIIIKHGYDMRIYINFVASITRGEPNIAPANEQLNRNENIKEIKWFSTTELENMKEEDFINDISFEAIQKWINKEIYSLSLLEEKEI
jgi:ADP-ribose pyrophosphatase YjhB (NUDIX family)